MYIITIIACFTVTPKLRTVFAQRTFFYAELKAWNKLPPCLILLSPSKSNLHGCCLMYFILIVIALYFILVHSLFAIWKNCIGAVGQCCVILAHYESMNACCNLHGVTDARNVILQSACWSNYLLFNSIEISKISIRLLRESPDRWHWFVDCFVYRSMFYSVTVCIENMHRE